MSVRRDCNSVNPEWMRSDALPTADGSMTSVTAQRTGNASPTTGRGSCRIAAFPTRLGWMAIVCRQQVLCQLTFGHPSKDAAIAALGCPNVPVDAKGGLSWLIERLRAYAAGRRDDFRDIAVDLARLSLFQRRVIENCRRIPYGKTVTYAELAAMAGSPRASRAVGNCMAGNQVPIVVPCHRVVRSDGQLGNYSAPGGPAAKNRLLQMESSN